MVCIGAQITGFSQSRPAEDSKPANEVFTGFLPEVRLPQQGGKGQLCRDI
jgi:hypothetical protein